MIGSAFFKRHKQIFLLLFVLFFAFLPRIYLLRQIPPTIVDEPAYARDITSLLKEPGFHPSQMQWDSSQATLAYYPTIGLIKLGIVDKILALRLISVCFSILSLIPFFFIVKHYTSGFTAYCTTILFSSSYYFLEFSRVGWGVIYATTLGLYMMWGIQAINKRNIWYMTMITGILASLIFYTYRAGEIYILIGFLYFMRSISVYPIKKKISILASFIVTFFWTTLPWLQTIFSHWEKFNLREHVVSIFHIYIPYHHLYNVTDIFRYQILTTISSWIFMLPIQGGGNEDGRYLPGVYSPISPFLIIPFLIGLIISIKWYKQTWMWLCIFFLGLILGQIITVNPPNGARALIFLPVIYLFISFFLELTYITYKSKKILSILLVATFLVASSDILFYFYWMSWIKV